MPLTANGKNGLLDSGKTSHSHVSAFSDIGVTEITTTRQAVTYTTAASGIADNNAQISVPVNAGVTVQTAGAYSASSGGNIMSYMPIGSSGQLVKGVAVVDAIATDLCQSNGHGLTTDDRVFVCTVMGESLPSGLSATTLYYVLASGLTTDAFKLSTSSGGSAVDITALGEFAFFKTVPNTFASAGNLVIATGAYDLDLNGIG